MGDKKYVVYCHRNKLNGFEYVGMTGRNPKVRWSGKALGYANCKYFENALKEYGWDGFEHLVLFSGLTKKEAMQKETEIIRENIAKGISYNVREDNDWLGNLRKKQVDVYDLNGTLVDTCESIHEAALKYKTAETHAYYCACGKKKTVHGKYVFAFRGDDVDINERVKEAAIDRRYGFSAHNRKKVKMMSLDGSEIRVFDSATEASEFIGSHVSTLVTCCKGKIKSCKGYKWSYV